MKDRSWEKFGEKDPYYAVCTDPQYKSLNLNCAALEDFFHSGKKHVNAVLQTLQQKFAVASNHVFDHVLDFGCGTGRLVIPFAAIAKKVTGVDISQPMLDEAKKNLEAKDITNVELIQSSDINSLHYSEQFDLVHTYIVLQHIPVTAGYHIIDKLISMVRKGGYGAIHFTFANQKPAFKNKMYALKNRHLWIRKLGFLLQGKSINTPVMQMNNYDLEKVFRVFLSHNIAQIDIEFSDHGGFLGTMIYFKKPV